VSFSNILPCADVAFLMSILCGTTDG